MNDNPFLPPSSNLHARDSFGSSSDVSSLVLEGLARTKWWVRICGILMCMLFAFQALQLVLAVVGVDVTFGPGQTRSTVVGLAFLGFVISFFFYLWPAIRLLRYAKAIGFLLEQKTAVELEEALNIQRGFWKYIGIITLILLILFVGFLFLAMAGALATARH